MKKTHLFSTALFLALPVHAEQFISLSLCSDRLLAELAEPHQIAAQSPYSKNPLMMLDKVNQDKPTLEPTLTALLPYLDKTILLNENFYPQLTNDLKKLGVKIIPINDSPQTPNELFAMIRTLGKQLGREQQAVELVEKLAKSDFKLNVALKKTLMITDTGIAEPSFPQYKVMLDLLGLAPIDDKLTPQNFSLEKVLQAEPNWLIEISDQVSYNEQSELRHHLILKNLFQNRPLFRIPMKYTYCFDHGVWMGAERIYHQYNDE